MQLRAGTRVPTNSAPSGSGGHLLRVAVVTETYPPEVNGVATTVARIVSGLIQKGHHVEEFILIQKAKLQADM